MVASLLSAVLLNPEVVDQFYGWRIAFALEVVLAIGVLLVRRYVPEGPRWLMAHGKAEVAVRASGNIEDEVRRYTGHEELPPVEGCSITVEQREGIGFGTIARVVFRMYPVRSVLGLVLMISQAFLYNAIFFAAGLVLVASSACPRAASPTTSCSSPSGTC